MAENIVLNHGDHLLTAVVGSGIQSSRGAYLRIFDPAGVHEFLVDATEAQALIDLLHTVMAEDAEQRLKQSKEMNAFAAMTVGSGPAIGGRAYLYLPISATSNIGGGPSNGGSGA